MSSNFKMVSKIVIELKKGLEILKDEPGQSQIPLLGTGGKLKRDVKKQSKSIAGMNLKIQI